MNVFKLINKEVRIEPTNLCNAHCIMCPREKLQRQQGIMDMNLYKSIIDQCVVAGAQKVSLENFGEPFLDPYIFERAVYAKNKGLEVLTISNGSLIDEDKAKKIVDVFDVIRFSLYGMTKETYEKIHRKLNFEKSIKNIDYLISLKEETKSNINIQIYFLLMEQNKEEKDLFLQKYEEKVNGVGIWIPHNWGDGRIYRNLLNEKKSCGRPFTGPLQVQWDGKVVPCCFDYDSKMVLGDLNNQTIEEVFKSQEYNRIRKAHSENNFEEFTFCQNCDQLNKREDVLIYTNIKNSKIGSTNTDYFDLKK